MNTTLVFRHVQLSLFSFLKDWYQTPALFCVAVKHLFHLALVLFFDAG